MEKTKKPLCWHICLSVAHTNTSAKKTSQRHLATPTHLVVCLVPVEDSQHRPGTHDVRHREVLARPEDGREEDHALA